THASLFSISTASTRPPDHAAVECDWTTSLLGPGHRGVHKVGNVRGTATLLVAGFEGARGGGGWGVGGRAAAGRRNHLRPGGRPRAARRRAGHRPRAGPASARACARPDPEQP